MAFTPDSWAYWEGSVSILEGCGWKYISGPPITDWPPLFTWYLVAAQAVLGQTVFALLVASAALLAVAVVGWARLLRLAHGGWDTVSVLAAVYVAMFLIPWHTVLLSETLALALLPFLLSELVEGGTARTVRSPQLVRMTLPLTGLLLTRHASLAYVPATVLIPMLWWTATIRSRLAPLAAAVVAVMVWRLMNWWLDLPTETRIDWSGLTASIARRTTELASGLGWAMATTRFSLDNIAIGMVAGGLVAAVAHRVKLEARWLAIRTLLTFAAISTASLVILVAITNPVDQLAGRFILYLVPILVISAAITGAATPPRWAGALALLLLTFLFTVQAARVLAIANEGSWSQWGPILPPPAVLTTTPSGMEGAAVPPAFPRVTRTISMRGCGEQ